MFGFKNSFWAFIDAFNILMISSFGTPAYAIVKIVASSNIENLPPTSSCTSPERSISPLSTALLRLLFSLEASVIAINLSETSFFCVCSCINFFAASYAVVVSKVPPDFDTTKNFVLSKSSPSVNLLKLSPSTAE